MADHSQQFLAAPLLAVLMAGMLATLIDVRTRRIPNWLTAATAATGVVFALTGQSGLSVSAAILGAIVGGLLMIPGHTLGATGAGDVKLLAAFGAVLGPGRIVTAFLFMAIAGGVLALAFAMTRGRLRTTVRRTAGLCIAPAATRDEVRTAGSVNSFPYGPAIAIGCLLAALGHF